MTHDELILSAALNTASTAIAHYLARVFDLDHGRTDYTQPLLAVQRALADELARAEQLLRRMLPRGGHQREGHWLDHRCDIEAADTDRWPTARHDALNDQCHKADRPQARSRTPPRRTLTTSTSTATTSHRSTEVTTVDIGTRSPRTYLTEQMWEREVRLIMRDHAMDRALAERTFEQTIAYLLTCAENPDLPMGPTPAVDKGVHSFILDTPSYSDFCMRHAGRYIHHVPHLPEERTSQPQVLQPTIQAIRTAGFPLDKELWGAHETDCHQCHACCADSPK